MVCGFLSANYWPPEDQRRHVQQGMASLFFTPRPSSHIIDFKGTNHVAVVNQPNLAEMMANFLSMCCKTTTKANKTAFSMPKVKRCFHVNQQASN